MALTAFLLENCIYVVEVSSCELYCVIHQQLTTAQRCFRDPIRVSRNENRYSGSEIFLYSRL